MTIMGQDDFARHQRNVRGIQPLLPLETGAECWSRRAGVSGAIIGLATLAYMLARVIIGA